MITLTVTVTDGKDNGVGEVTLNYGTAAQIATYNLLKPYFGVTLNGSVGNLVILEDGTLTSNESLDFYTAANATSANYEILSNGKVQLDVSGQGIRFVEYTVSAFSLSNVTGLTFTNDNTSLNVY